MFAEILTVVPLILPPISPDGGNHRLYVQAPSITRVASAIAPLQSVPAPMGLELSSFLPAGVAPAPVDYSRYDSAPSLQRLVLVTVPASLGASQPLPPQDLTPAAQQLPPGGFTLTDVTDDLAWRRETAGRLRGIFE